MELNRRLCKFVTLFVGFDQNDRTCLYKCYTKYEDAAEVVTISLSRICSLVPPSVHRLRKEITPEITKLDPGRRLPKSKHVLLIIENTGHREPLEKISGCAPVRSLVSVFHPLRVTFLQQVRTDIMAVMRETK
jgi:hypothetical protein